MQVTAAELNRATLARQLLLDRAEVDVVEAVRRVTALQGQEPAAPYVALWNRVAGFDPAAMDAAFRDGRLVRASLMRLTLHVVTAEDHRQMRAAMLPRLRASRVFDRRYRSEGLEPAEADEIAAAVRDVTVEPLPSSQVVARLGERLGREVHPRLWWALRTYGPVVRAPSGEPWGFAGTEAAFVSSPVADDELPDRDEAVRARVRRYLEGFGPASVADVAQFSMLTRRTVRTAVAAMEDELHHIEGPDGAQLLDLRGLPVPDGDVPAAPRLLGMWDSTLLAYDDRSRVLPAAHRAQVIRRNGDTLPAVLVDGLVRGVWRQVEGSIEVTPLAPFDRSTWDGLAAEAASLVAMLAERDPRTFGRYDRWWDRLPDDRRRVLPGD